MGAIRENEFAGRKFNKLIYKRCRPTSREVQVNVRRKRNTEVSSAELIDFHPQEEGKIIGFSYYINVEKDFSI